MSDYELPLDREELRELDAEQQVEVMRSWFRSRYEDPANRTPYDSGEGGYQWIWGGPYDAREELGHEFEGFVDEPLIEALVDDLESDCVQWAPVESPGDYEDFYIESFVDDRDVYTEFGEALERIRKLNSANVEAAVAENYRAMLYSACITALEVYLGDTLIQRVQSSDLVFQRYVRTTPEFQQEKFSLSEIHKTLDGLSAKAREYLTDVVWHNLGRVKPLYRDTLKETFRTLARS